MIEAIEYVTPTQRKLHEEYKAIHRRFFPSAPPPIKPKLTVTAEPPPKQPCPRIVPLESTNWRLKIIKQTVCSFYNIDEDSIKSARRTKDIVRPRHMISYLAAKFTKASLPHIGRLLGGQDHTTILHGIRKMKERLPQSQGLMYEADKLEAILVQHFGTKPAARDCIGRYVVHEKVEGYFACGWMWAANLNEYAALMIWPCGCKCVEPVE